MPAFVVGDGVVARDVAEVEVGEVEAGVEAEEVAVDEEDEKDEDDFVSGERLSVCEGRPIVEKHTIQCLAAGDV
jgi:hypothetical protein